ncbi:hypothetical protein C1S82_03045 [Mycolicibacterium cosmeticum]|nr:hypothetical protein C1S82_03045 [Mycolicibacterium cosmeticum]
MKASAAPPESAPAREPLRPTPESPAARSEDHSIPPRDQTPSAAAEHPVDPAGSSHDPGTGNGPAQPEHSGPVGNPANDRIYGPHQLDHVEDPAYQRAVEDALRDSQGDYVRHADPRTNDYGNLINDGGPTVDGRSNNCLDCSLSALSSFRGEPTVAAPRYLDELPDGTIDRQSGEHNGLNRAQNWLGNGLLEFPGHKLVDQFDLLHQYIDQLGPGSAALVVNGWHARDLVSGEYLFDAHGNPITSGSHATVIVHPESGGGPVWWDPQQGLTSDRPPAWMVNQSTYLNFTPIEPSQGAHHAGIGDQGAGAGVSGRDVSEPDLSRATVSTRVDSDESAFHGADGLGPGSGPGAAGDRFGDGDRLPVPELVGDDGGRGVHDVQGDGVQPGGEPDLSASVGDHDSTHTGGHGDDRVSVDGDVAEQSPRTDAGTSLDDREAHGPVRSEGSAVESGGLTREMDEPSESGRVAGDGHHLSVGEHNDGGVADQAASTGIPDADVTNRDIPSATDPEGMGSDEGAHAGTDGLGSSTGPGAAGDRFGDGDRLSVPELVGDDGGRGVHDVQGDGIQPGREPDLPASVTDHDPAGTGGRADHRLSDDGGVADRSPDTHPAESLDHREADSGSRAERVAGERGDVARGVDEPTEPRGVAGGGDDRGVGGNGSPGTADAVGSNHEHNRSDPASTAEEDQPDHGHAPDTTTDPDNEHRPDNLDEFRIEGGQSGERYVELADGSHHRVWASNEQLSSQDSRFAAADAWLAERGLSRADIQPLLVQPADWLNSAQRELVYSFRHQFSEVGSGEALQKVIDSRQADSRLDDGPKRYPPDATGGSVSVARDTHELNTPDRIYDGLALEYEDTPFHPQKPVVAMRFTVDDGVPIHLPDEQLSQLTGNGPSFDPGYPYPFTGTGFTASERFTVPEYFLPAGTTMNPGAEMYRIATDGSEELIAVLGPNQEWIGVVSDG